jgi:hypothetical protein
MKQGTQSDRTIFWVKEYRHFKVAAKMGVKSACLDKSKKGI